MGFTGEFSALYILKRGQQRGIGRTLMTSMAAELMRDSLRGASLLVLRENRAACQFYEYIGGVAVSERNEARGDITLTKVVYGWRDLANLTLARSQKEQR